MTPYYDNGRTRLFMADARSIPLDDASVDCIVTSPPYWGLRDYGNAAQIGMEPTPAEYVCSIVSVFDELWRVLKPTGTAWLNLGDSYATGTTSERNPSQTGKHGYWENPAVNKRIDGREIGLKPKDLVGIPWMVAFALQEAGWWLRSDIIWAKPNPMPESVTDRPTRSHEYLFLLTKAERYYYDAEAIREMSSSPLKSPDGNGSTISGGKHSRHTLEEAIPQKERRTDKQRGHSRPHAGFNDRWDGMTKAEQSSMGRNKRDVWTIATQPYPDAHFATFPEALVEPCILAGCPEGGLVLDPFVGSGTTAAVAQRLGRRAVGLDLSDDYLALAAERIGKVSLPMELH